MEKTDTVVVDTEEEDRDYGLEEFEKDMQKLVDSFHCEWRLAIEDPNIRKRFRHFVNSDESDSNIKFVPVRAQKRPEAWKT